MRALRSLGGEPGPALRSPALEDRAAGTRRHAGAEAVLTLPPAHIWLISPLHEKSLVRKGRRPSGAFRDEYSPRGSPRLSTARRPEDAVWRLRRGRRLAARTAVFHNWGGNWGRKEYLQI